MLSLSTAAWACHIWCAAMGSSTIVAKVSCMTEQAAISCASMQLCGFSRSASFLHAEVALQSVCCFCVLLLDILTHLIATRHVKPSGSLKDSKFVNPERSQGFCRPT